MDLIKIGKYIAGKRKDLGMTQRQLAEKLNMSDKSVSKWERGVCLPDVSVYSELCMILGIGINEFLAGEDIAGENLEKKSEENIIGVASDSKHKQKKLKLVIAGLTAVLLVALSFIAAALYRANMPQNFIVPFAENSTEMQTVKLLSGPDGAHVYRFVTTDEYKSLKLNYKEFAAGELLRDEQLEIDFDGIGSPGDGEILIIPDFKNFAVKLIISTDNSKLSTEIPVLEDVEGREYYGRSASRIEGESKILYGTEQPLVALIYDNDAMRVLDLYEIMGGNTEALAMNDYVYLFTYEFGKE